MLLFKRQNKVKPIEAATTEIADWTRGNVYVSVIVSEFIDEGQQLGRPRYHCVRVPCGCGFVSNAKRGNHAAEKSAYIRRS
jgi:hypothetical protein